MRVGLINIIHESNSFIATPTTLDDFRRDTLVIGDEIRPRFANSHHETGGVLDALDEAGVEVVPMLATHATPIGEITHETLESLMSMMHEQFDLAGPLDGIVLGPHGAAVSERERDMDGYWLSQVRQWVGNDVPLVTTMDPHGNLTPKMINAVDAIFVYRTNPHIDQYQQGIHAANLVVKTIRGEVKPTMAACFPRICINIERQHTPSSPCREMYALADEMLKRPGVLSNSVVLGFPYSDVVEMGSGFLVVTDNNRDLAQRYADELGRYLFNHREAFVPEFITVEEAIDQAETDHGPVCLLDMGDNVGGGSSADGTFIAHAVHHRGGPKTFIALYDEESVRQAEHAGVGSRVTLRMGGKTDDQHGKPVEAEVEVKGFFEGTFTESEVRHGAHGRFDMGRTAIVETSTGLTVQLTSQRTVPVSLNQMLSCELDPKAFQILVAKGVHAPVAAYEPVCEKLIRVNTAGASSADMSRFVFRHRRRPLFPFEPIDESNWSGF